MNKSNLLELNLPSRDNTTDVADINAISDNFEIIDGAFGNLVEKEIPKLQTKENMNLNFDDDSTYEEQYPNVPAVVSFTNRKVDPLKIINSASGNAIALKDSANDKLKGLKLYGKTTQNGTPTPDAPVPLVSVGDSGSFEVGVYGGKNFVDTNGYKLSNYYVDAGGKEWVYNYGQTLLFVPIVPNTTYTYTGGASGYGGCCFADSNKQPIGISACTYANKNTPQTFTTPNNAHYFVIGSYVASNQYQLELGTQATPYEPCNKQSLTMPYNPLRIPVLVDYNYIDENRKKYICDEIDLNKGVFKSRIIKTLLNGSETYTLNSKGVIQGVLSGAKGNWVNYLALSTHFTYNSTIVNTNEKAGYFAIDGNGGIYLTTDFTTVAEFKTWLQSNNVTVYAVRATPIETPLTETELNAYRQLHTNKPNTTILSEADTEVSYVADTKLYIDNKIAELTALTLEG
jgi:hypothetical protein